MIHIGMLILSLHLPWVRIEACIFASFIACCLQETLRDISCRRVGGLTLHAAIEAFRTFRMGMCICPPPIAGTRPAGTERTSNLLSTACRALSGGHRVCRPSRVGSMNIDELREPD